MRIDGELIVDRYEVWSIKRTSTDGEVTELAFEDEQAARLEHAFYGGRLWVRQCFASEGHEVEMTPVEDLTV